MEKRNSWEVHCRVEMNWIWQMIWGVQEKRVLEITHFKPNVWETTAVLKQGKLRKKN